MWLDSGIHAGVSYRLEEFESKGLTGDFGYLSKNGGSYAKATLSPEFKLGPLEIGSNVNFYLPLTSGYSSEFNISLRKVAYTTDNYGFKWGALSKITFGYGLLMDDFDTTVGGESTEYTTSQGGFLGYGKLNNTRADVLWTPNHLMAYRASYTLENSMIMGSPIVFGANYVNDSDGVEGTDRKAQQGYGADIGLPIAGDFLTLFTEYAQLSKSENNNDQDTKGASAGVKGNLGPVDYKFEYRSLGAGFIPSYFNTVYEATELPTAPTEKVSGFLGAAAVNFFDDYCKAGLQYEKYDNLDMFTAAFGWKEINHTVGVINYSRPLGNGGSSAVADADILYLTGTSLDYVVHIKREYANDSSYTESYSVGFRMNLNKMFPSLPF